MIKHLISFISEKLFVLNNQVQAQSQLLLNTAEKINAIPIMIHFPLDVEKFTFP